MFWTVMFSLVLFLAPVGLLVSADPPEAPADGKAVSVGTAKEGEVTTIVVTEKDGKMVIETGGKCVVTDAGPGKRVCKVVTAGGDTDPATGDGTSVRVEKRVVVRCGEDGEKVVIEGEAPSDVRKMVFRLNEKDTLDGLKDGESRTLGEKGCTLTVTRKGDRLFLKVDGLKDLPEIPLDLGKGDKEKSRRYCVRVCKEKGGEDAEPIVLVDRDAAGDRDIRLRLKVKTGQETLRFRVNDEDFEVGVGDLAEGQPKTLSRGNCTLTLTREGDEVSVKVEKTPIVP
ncbi:MAG: hypothetical protein KA419_10725 [Acidobacteria bacterium]|nr:hypothetical protein [Acidobacteriota bacterium]